ncbi:hypothetical protein BU17DRAFT_82909 [Hysterangium stoloniferum]|nr:hypothetical protein BU17DRAFT_82909 [Hysterangium stoloniferum]
MSISLGYQLPGFNGGFSPFLAAVTGFKPLAHLELNLGQAVGLFGWLTISDMKCSLYSTASILKDSLATLSISKPFGNRPSCVAHLLHALHVHIEETICRELKQQHAAVIGHSPSALRKANPTIHPKSQTAGDDGSEYTVPESSFIDDDDGATDQKVLTCMSMQRDLSPSFGSCTSLLCGDLQKLLKIRNNCRYSCESVAPALALPPPQWTVKGSIIMDTDKKSMQRRRLGGSGGVHHLNLPSHDGTGHGAIAVQAYEQAKVFTS